VPAFAYDDYHLDAGRPTFRPPESTLGAFGEKLRRQREQRGITLDAISTTTKISPRMLRAIEDEHFDQLPGGVFNKGFVRAYARQVGLDEEEAISDYLAALRESQVQSQTILPNFRTSADHPSTETSEPEPSRQSSKADLAGKAPQHREHTGSPISGHDNKTNGDSVRDRRIQADDRRKDPRRNQDRTNHAEHAHAHNAHRIEDRTEESLAEDVPLPLSFLNLTSSPSLPHVPAHHHSEPFEKHGAADNSSRRIPWGTLVAALLLITLTLALWTLRRRNQSEAASHPALPSQTVTSSPLSPNPAVPAPALVSTKPSAVSSLTAKSSSPSTALANHSSATAPATNVTGTSPPVAKPHPLEPVAKPPVRFTLMIRADQTSWVAISADGQPVAQETLIAPANTSVRASNEIIVKAGNAAGISFLLNGKEIPALGNPGEVRTFTFDATGMRASSSVQSANTTR
jgi:cytoskeletal protein RodZ